SYVRRPRSRASVRVLAGETLGRSPPSARDRPCASAWPCRPRARGVRRLGLVKMLPNGPERRAKLILAVARIIEPAANLATGPPVVLGCASLGGPLCRLAGC